jgi:putative ABC transport system permease protein
MILHFLKHTLRLFSRNRMYSLINLLGLSLGLTTGIIILMIVGNQLSHDRFHNNRKNIYQVSLTSHSKDHVSVSNTIPAAIGPSIQEEFPEVSMVTRVSQPVPGYLSFEDQTVVLNKISWVDSTFFKTFTFQLLDGRPEHALSSLWTAVVTQTTASALFGGENPLGRVIRLNNEIPYTITGVVKDPPSGSHIQFDVLLSFSSLYEDKNLHMGWDGGNRYMNYLVLSPEADVAILQEKLPPFMWEKINKQIEPYGFRMELNLHPLTTLYLHSGLYGNPMLFIYVLAVIGLLVLIIAAINFTNLSTAQAIKRARETGIRKVAGATHRGLAIQYTGEAVLIALGAFTIALLFVELVQPYVNAVTGLELSIFSREWNRLVPALAAMVIFTGIISGAYPAFYLASFKPARVLKGGFETAKGRNTLSMALVVLQFVISITLINASFVIFRQLSYLNRFDTGMNTSQVMWLSLPGKKAMEGNETLRNEIISIAGVEACGATSEIPGRWVTSNGYRLDNSDDVSMIHVLDVDAGFLETLSLTLVDGRNFTRGSEVDKTTYLVNESFIKHYGVEDFQSLRVRRNGTRPVIGVVKDFHFASLKYPVKPLIITNDPYEGFAYLLIRINPATTEHALAQIEAVWKQLQPGDPFVYGYVDDYISSSYITEKRIGKVFSTFTLILLFIACIGLFGLSSLMIRQRQKEIGLRRLMGASSGSILKMVTGKFIALVLLANALAVVPLYFIVQTLLEYYSYSVSYNYWWFILTGVATLLLAAITVGWQSYRISQTNPAEVIRYE